MPRPEDSSQNAPQLTSSIFTVCSDIKCHLVASIGQRPPDETPTLGAAEAVTAEMQINLLLASWHSVCGQIPTNKMGVSYA